MKKQQVKINIYLGILSRKSISTALSIFSNTWSNFLSDCFSEYTWSLLTNLLHSVRCLFEQELKVLKNPWRSFSCDILSIVRSNSLRFIGKMSICASRYFISIKSAILTTCGKKETWFKMFSFLTKSSPTNAHRYLMQKLYKILIVTEYEKKNAKW